MNVIDLWIVSATQLLSRGIPFVFNSWIVRHLTQEDYAVSIFNHLCLLRLFWSRFLMYSYLLSVDLCSTVSSFCHMCFVPQPGGIPAGVHACRDKMVILNHVSTQLHVHFWNISYVFCCFLALVICLDLLRWVSRVCITYGL